MAYRVALVGIYHESNTFIDTPTTMDDFERGHLLVGDTIRSEYQHAYHEIGGMLHVMDVYGMEVVPVLFAEATPGGVVASDTYEALKSQLLAGVRTALPLDGCLVVPHGAGVSEAIRDMDGDWLAELRSLLGPDIPIVGTLDLHANVSERMIEATDALVSYRENPHTDQRERGMEAARLLVDCLTGKIRPKQYLVQSRVAISIEQQHTAAEPCNGLYTEFAALREQADVLGVHVALGFPYADVEEMGTSVWCIANGDRNAAKHVADQAAQYLMVKRNDFVGTKISIEAAMDHAHNAGKPVLLLDMGDNIGGGAPGNGLALLAALQHWGACRFFMCIWDPQAVAQGIDLTVNEPATIVVNGFGAQGAETHVLNAAAVRHVDGRFRETAPRHGGQVTFDMGDTLIATLANGSMVMVMSYRIAPFSLEQLTAFGIDPAGFDLIVAKGVHAPLAAYQPVCGSVIQVDTPGVTQADMTRFTYAHRRKPLFPFEDVGGEDGLQ